MLSELFWTFARVGLFTFGGGYAMISMIENICVERKKWITHDEMMQMTVIAESTPGPLAINCATYVGYQKGGIPGSVAATVGLVLPSFAVILLISTFLENYLEIDLIARAFRGIRIGVSVLILSVGFGMLKKMPRRRQARITAACAFAAMLLINLLSLRISSITLMLIAGLASLLLFIAGGAPEMKGGARK